MDKRVSLKEKVSYGIGSGGGNIITQLVGTFLIAYYTDSVGIAATAIGTMMLVTRLLDGITDILMGGIIDKTKSKWGKTRPWLFISAPFVCIGLILTFNVPWYLSDSGKIVYAYLTYIFLNCISFTIYMISHTSLLSRVTLDPHDRQVMSSVNQIVNNLVQLIVMAITVGLVSNYGWKVISIIYGIITAIMILICFFGTKEHLDLNEKTNEVKIETVPLKIAVPALLKNKYFYLLAMIFILILAIASSNGSVTYYYCNIILENPGMMAGISMAFTLPIIISNFFVPYITKAIGHQKTLIISSFLILIGFLVIGLGKNSEVLVIIGSIIRGFGTGPMFACGFALSAQVVDYGEWKFNVRSEGLINSCVSFGQKVGLGLGGAIAGWIIGASGYTGAEVVYTEAIKNSIIFSYVWLGVILSVILIIVCIYMNIDKHSKEVKTKLELTHKSYGV